MAGRDLQVHRLADVDALVRERARPEHPASVEGPSRRRWLPVVKNKATDEELNLLIAAAELAGVGKGSLEAVILGTFDFATNGRYKPIDRLTSSQCKKLTDFLKAKAVEQTRKFR